MLLAGNWPIKRSCLKKSDTNTGMINETELKLRLTQSKTIKKHFHLPRIVVVVLSENSIFGL